MTGFSEWIKGIYNTVYNFFDQNFLLFLVITSLVIIVLFFLIARICTSGNYYARLGKKFKKLNVIIRNNQINEDREKFLINFNKEVKKKNKTFASAWNSYILDDGQDASLIFKNTKLDHGKKGFFNFFLIFSWIVPFCVVALILSFRKFDFSSDEAIYIMVLVPVFIITLGLLFNLIYINARNGQRKSMLEHSEFFINNVDEAIKGFEKSDFELCGINRIKNVKLEDIDVLEYENYLGTREVEKAKDKALIDLINNNLAEDKTNKALTLAKDIEQRNLNVDLEQKAHDEEKVIQFENENQLDESKEKLLNNLKRLKNLEILTEEKEIDKDHPFGDVDAEKKLQIENEVVALADSKKTELNAKKKGKSLRVLEATPVGTKKLVKVSPAQTSSKKPSKAKEKDKSVFDEALANLEKAKDDSNLTKAVKNKKATTEKTSSKKGAQPKKNKPAENKKPEQVKAEKQVKEVKAKVEPKVEAKPEKKQPVKVATKKTAAKKTKTEPKEKITNAEAVRPKAEKLNSSSSAKKTTKAEPKVKAEKQKTSKPKQSKPAEKTKAENKSAKDVQKKAEAPKKKPVAKKQPQEVKASEKPQAKEEIKEVAVAEPKIKAEKELPEQDFSEPRSKLEAYIQKKIKEDKEK